MASLSHKRGGKPRAAGGIDASPPVGHVYFDARRLLLYCLNEAARRYQADGVPFTGADLARQPLLTFAGDPVLPTDMPLTRAAREGRPCEGTFVLVRKGSALQHLHWTAAPLWDGSAQLLAVVGTVSVRPPEPDWQMLAGLAHDLRNPIQALRLSLDELPPDDALPAELREPLDRIRRSAERALSVGKDILEWCRGPAQGGRRIDPTWFALEPFLAALAEEQALAARHKGLGLVQDLRAVRGWEVLSDKVRLSRLLTNLLSNAVRYTSTGRVEFAASWRQETAGRRLVLAVHDTGAGITPEEQESIFQPFERGSAARGDSTGGSGLGLAVVDRLVEELHLGLEMSSDVGQGSSFGLLIPSAMLRQSSP
jgi:signal transduction histidine kinase